MKLYKTLCAALLLVGASFANASVILTGSIDTGSEVDYVSFSMTSDSFLEINVLARGFNGSRLDSYIYLYRPDVSGALVGRNDDSRSGNWNADGSTSGLDSYLNIFLTAGNYTLAIGDFFLSDTDARDGFNESNASDTFVGAYQITFTGNGFVTDVPAPIGLSLLGLGLLGFSVSRSRRKA
ncbi:DVUA0089 family protein [Glaciecola sp. MH2013]|uniref:DVUA0089 family protein n=1 Tax=Glaciecola sp. MH2013 TaxID=2785524 RepID=UPI00189F9E56|nr:DVUA0089 family protein [Glaciecola sp. MH2013]MBF7074275.1 DVUA0089 family protein [Glaciecola sp. MH2013]